MNITADLVQMLIAEQFPQWSHLPVSPVEVDGWDNRTFRLGTEMSVRLPSAERYIAQVQKEDYWLPLLAPLLPLPIPVPLAIGKPGAGYEWPWSVRRWIDGQTAIPQRIVEPVRFAKSLAQFLTTLWHIDLKGGPPPGQHNFFRGGSLTVYDSETHATITSLAYMIDAATATEVWDAALAAQWQGEPLWIHGDVSEGNILVDRQGDLSAVIDFGGLTVGDPACDLTIAWTLLSGESREAFRAMLPVDSGTWARARGWALWKALILIYGQIQAKGAPEVRTWRVYQDVLADHAAYGSS